MDQLRKRPPGGLRRPVSPPMSRHLAVETLEPRQLLTANFGFVDTPSGFAFQISGTDFDFNPDTPAEPDNIIVGTSPSNFQTNFAIEWVTDSGSWRSLVGGVGTGDIASEARRRGLGFEDFDGFLIKAKGGSDTVHADGSGTFGIRTGAPSSAQFYNSSVSPFALIGYSLIAHGNGGHDRIFGSPGGDILQGGPGDDTISGMAGDDIIFGDMGDDDILAGDNQDQVHGGSGRDEIFAQAGNDFVWGDEDDDVIVGGAGHDVIHGGQGDDDLVGDDPHTNAGGIDKLIGGDGDDSLLGDNFDQNPEGGNGTDAFQAGPSTVASGSGGPTGFQIINSDIEKLDTTGADPGEPTLKDGKRFDRPGPFSGSVELFPDDELKTMAGISQDPFTPGPYGSFNLNNQVNSSSADSQVSGENALGLGPLTNPMGVSLGTSLNGVIMISGAGDDWLAGSDFDDYIDTGAGNDVLEGNRGVDALLAGDGSDRLDGGAGGDIIDGDGGMQPGPGGIDVLTYATSSAGVTVSLDPPLAADSAGNTVDSGSEDLPAKQADMQLNGFPSPGLGGGDAQDDLIIKADAHDSTIERLSGSPFGDFLLIAGGFDTDGEGFDPFVISVVGGKYRTGRSADRSDGDVNGDGVFDQFDVIAIMQTGFAIARGS